MNRMWPIGVLVASVWLGACESEGPAEQTGEKIDDAVEQSGEKMERAADKAAGTIEQAGDKAEQKTN